MPRPFRHVIFDLDGTLIDSKPGIHASLKEAFGRLGHELDGDLDWVLGPPLEHVVKRLLAPFGDDRSGLAVAYYREVYGDKGLFNAQPYQGIPALLADLSDSGRTLFVATSKLTPFARRVLDHFGLSGHFTWVEGNEVDAPPVSKAELIKKLLIDLRLDPTKAIVVGDREHDMIGARSNHLGTVGVLYGYGSREELLTAGADDLCDSPESLRQFL
jgi:phosphoglycolate phosphatase